MEESTIKGVLRMMHQTANEQEIHALYLNLVQTKEVSVEILAAMATNLF